MSDRALTGHHRTVIVVVVVLVVPVVVVRVKAHKPCWAGAYPGAGGWGGTCPKI